MTARPSHYAVAQRGMAAAMRRAARSMLDAKLTTL
jgi:hypothetical protein